MAWEKVAGAAVAVAVLLGFVALLWPLARDRFIYPGGELSPDRADPELHGLPRSEQVWLETEDGVRIHGWWTPAGPPAGGRPGNRGPLGAGPWGRGTVIYCHGNAESLATRAWIADRLAGMGFHVLLFDYRGYGLSEGRPSEEGLARDARVAWRHVVEDRGIAPDRIFLMGHSLGSAVATRLALELDEGDDSPAGLIVGSPFPDMPSLFRHHAPWLPRWTLRWRRDRHDAGSRLAELDAPALIVVGTDDEVVPPALSRSVAASVPAATVVVVPADHGTVMGHPAVWDAIRRFAQESLAD